MIAYLFEGLATVMVLAVLGLNAMATYSLCRTAQLTKSQKLAQGAIVWLIPFGGSLLVLHLLVESDSDTVHRRWIPNETVNQYVLQALRIEAQTLEKAAEHQVEQSVIESLSDHAGHSGGGDAGGHGGD